MVPLTGPGGRRVPCWRCGAGGAAAAAAAAEGVFDAGLAKRTIASAAAAPKAAARINTASCPLEHRRGGAAESEPSRPPLVILAIRSRRRTTPLTCPGGKKAVNSKKPECRRSQVGHLV